MHLRTVLKLACLSAALVAACDDADLDEVDDNDIAAPAAGDEEDAPLRAADDEDDAEQANRLTLDPGLDLRADPDDGAVTVPECSPGQVKTFSTPNGVCGGCVINGSYPGQKYYDYYRVCDEFGHWSGQYAANPPTSCRHC